ncbi:MAG: DUF3344 domain-containing protein [Euryarchaeota archaeon]|nr:MAG: hypothetical protein C5S47_05815 [ANME-2 cluster archaeon]MEA1866039.1 DUF3344 domain-containing protein [Euryarchaeota archaeon]
MNRIHRIRTWIRIHRSLTLLLTLLISVTLAVIASPAAIAGEWHGSGTPLYTIASGGVHGSVYVGGGYGLTYEDPYVEYFDLPANIIYARMYVPMWNYNRGDTLTVSINKKELEIRGEPDYIAAWGVSCYAYDVTDVAFNEGINTISATYENNNGGPYGLFLVAVYENESMPYTQFWIDEGNYALSKAVAADGGKNRGDALFPGDVSTNTVKKADLWTVIIAGTGGEVDELWFNSKSLGTDIGRAKTGNYLDFDHFDVTPDIISHNNTAILKRGDEQYIHLFNAVLLVEHDDNVKGDTKLTIHEAQSSTGPGIPIPVIAVLVISIIGFFLIYLKKKQERGRD